MHPDALLYVDVPPVPALAGRPKLPGRWVLDHVVAADRPALSEAWRRAHDEGIATVEARVVGGGRARFDFLDVTGAHGVFVVVATEQDGAQLGTADLESHALLPRHCRVL